MKLSPTYFVMFLLISFSVTLINSYAQSQYEQLVVKSFAMISNGAGDIDGFYGFAYTTPPDEVNGAYSTDWYRDYPSSVSDVWPDGMQERGGFYYVVADPYVTDYEYALYRWTRNGANYDRIKGRHYEIRFTEDGGKGFYRFNSGNVVDIPFELWELGEILNDPSDDVRMIPLLYDNPSGDPDVFDFALDH